jgi:class 3 adenylate cyclase
VAESLAQLVEQEWGSIELSKVAFPSRSSDAEFMRWVAKLQRAAATPRSAAVQYRYMIVSMDVRAAIPLIQAPTLVMHTSGNPFTPVEHGRFFADAVSAARYVEFDSNDGALYGEAADLVVDEVARFLTGQLPPVDVDRVLTTVVFTDIVASTARAASEGDKRWRSILDAHDRLVRDELRAFRGREIKTTGDGFLASFDGPARAIRFAKALTGAATSLGIEVRAGVHTGECEIRGDDLAGLAVHIAARVGALAAPSEVLVSHTVTDLVIGSAIPFEDRGEHELKGVPGRWKLFAVTS